MFSLDFITVGIASPNNYTYIFTTDIHIGIILVYT